MPEPPSQHEPRGQRLRDTEATPGQNLDDPSTNVGGSIFEGRPLQRCATACGGGSAFVQFSGARYPCVVGKGRKTPSKTSKAGRPSEASDWVAASNRRARRDYDILQSLECGIVLQGSEVKSLREGKAQLADAYARIDDGELWLFGLHIPPWKFASGFGGHDADRKRKLLVHRGQIAEFNLRLQTQPLTLIPLKIYFHEGKAKVELGLARGRKLHDKRNAIKERDAKREAERAVRNATRWS